MYFLAGFKHISKNHNNIYILKSYIKLENGHSNQRYRKQCATEAKKEKTDWSANWSHTVIYTLKKAHEDKWKITQLYILTAFFCNLLKEYLSESTPSDSSFVT